MKKIILILIICTLISCKKDEFINHQDESMFRIEEVKDSQFPSMNEISFTIDNNILNFETLEDYQLMLDYMCKIQEYDYEKFEEHLAFHSYRKEYQVKGKELPSIDVETFVLLNPEGSIIIEGHKFILNFYTEEIEVSEITEMGLKSLQREFDWNESVLDILFNDGQDSNLKSAAGITHCNGDQAYDEWEVGSSDVTIRLWYNNFPLAYKLKAKISQSPNFGGLDLYMDTYSYDPVRWQDKNNCNTRDWVNPMEGSGPSLSHTFYSSATKRLDAFDAKVFFSATYDGVPPYYDYEGGYGTIDCDVDELTCN